MGLYLLDSTANANTLTVSTNVTESLSTASVPANIAAANLANSAVLTAPDSDSLSITGDLTIEAWIYLNNTNGDRVITNKYGAAGNRAFQFYIDAAESFTWQSGSDGTNLVTKSEASGISLETWAHVAAVYIAAAGSIKFLLNGTQVGSTQTGLDTSLFDSTAAVGANTDATSSFIIDESRVWNVARTPTQINDNKALRIDPTTAGLKAYWQFDPSGSGLMNKYW